MMSLAQVAEGHAWVLQQQGYVSISMGYVTTKGHLDNPGLGYHLGPC